MPVKAYGKFFKENGNIYTKDVYLQFGYSEDIIGAAVFFKPCSGENIVENMLLVKEGELVESEIEINESMADLKEMLLSEEYSNLNGRVYLYSVSNIVNDYKDYRHPWINREFLKLGFQNYRDNYKKYPFTLIYVGKGDRVLDDYGIRDWLDFLDSNKINYISLSPSKVKNQDKARSIEEKPRELVKFQKSALFNSIIIDGQENKIEQDLMTSYSTNKAANIINGYSNLKLKDDFKIVTYEVLKGVGTIGKSIAIDKDREVPKIYLDGIGRDNFIFTDEVYDFMEGIEGDRSPISYLQAAIVYQHIKALGSVGLFSDWTSKRFLPTNVNYSDWDFEEMPEDFNPYYYEDQEGNIGVVFYLIDYRDRKDIKEYKTKFKKGSYIPKLEINTIGYMKVYTNVIK